MIVWLVFVAVLSLWVVSCRDTGDGRAAAIPGGRDREYYASRGSRISGPLAGYLDGESGIMAAGLTSEAEGRFEEALVIYRDARDLLERMDLPGRRKQYVPEIINLDIGRAALDSGRIWVG